MKIIYIGTPDYSGKRTGTATAAGGGYGYGGYSGSSGGYGGNGQFGGFGGNRNRVSYTEAVVPHTKNYGTFKNEFTLTLPENSIGIIKLTPTK